jgi:hypothetical protein
MTTVAAEPEPFHSAGFGISKQPCRRFFSITLTLPRHVGGVNCFDTIERFLQNEICERNLVAMLGRGKENKSGRSRSGGYTSEAGCA